MINRVIGGMNHGLKKCQKSYHVCSNFHSRKKLERQGNESKTR